MWPLTQCPLITGHYTNRSLRSIESWEQVSSLSKHLSSNSWHWFFFFHLPNLKSQGDRSFKMHQVYSFRSPMFVEPATTTRRQEFSHEYPMKKKRTQFCSLGCMGTGSHISAWKESVEDTPVLWYDGLRKINGLEITTNDEATSMSRDISFLSLSISEEFTEELTKL